MPILGWSEEEVYCVAERAYGLYRQGRLREAAILFEGIAAVDPHNTYVHKALAAVYLTGGDYWRAIRHLNVAVDRNPFDADALARRCEALIDAGDIAGARRDFDALASLPTQVQFARRLRMRLLAATGIRTINAESRQLPGRGFDN
jgi:Flp pilus assembly protein TadD